MAMEQPLPFQIKERREKEGRGDVFSLNKRSTTSQPSHCCIALCQSDMLCSPLSSLALDSTFKIPSWIRRTIRKKEQRHECMIQTWRNEEGRKDRERETKKKKARENSSRAFVSSADFLRSQHGVLLRGRRSDSQGPRWSASARKPSSRCSLCCNCNCLLHCDCLDQHNNDSISVR